MRVVTSSDWHGTPPPPDLIPPCDLLILAGDYGINSNLLADWLHAVTTKAKNVVGIAGNHDFDMQRHPALFRDELPWTYLQDSGTTVEGVKVWGSPWTKEFLNWAFMRPDHRLTYQWALIPRDTQILVTHGPPKGVLDDVGGGRHEGSLTLWKRIQELNHLRLHVFGHIHEDRGIKKVMQTTFVNTTQMGLYGTDTPIVFDMEF